MEDIKEIRKTILKIVNKANVSHIGSALSVVDILYSLYFKVANISFKNINNKNRDIIILSKGHSSAALYSVLYHRGFLGKDKIEKYSLDNGTLPCHIDREKSPFFEVSSGSLGHGASLGVGFALAKKIDKCSGRVFVICGDGECNEGSVWEALMFASSHKLNNFVFIVDYNKLQGFGKTNEIIDQSNLEDRIKTFGFQTYSIDGNNIKEVTETLLKTSDKPIAIVANTVKGKGVSFMENRLEWHYKSPNDEQLKEALKEIEEE
ncbi:MAG: transketolase [Candidatus Melainabacteria bacterium]|nr:MAG: transketolase [Candidatus Melainabacteria bacterium]